MDIKIANGIFATIAFIPKKSKTDKSKYCIYIGIYIYQNGVKQGTHTVSSGVTVDTPLWQNGTISGKGTKTQLLNEHLQTCFQEAKNMITMLGTKQITTCRKHLNTY